MKRWAKLSILGCSVLLSLSFVYFCYFAFRTPPIDLLALPDGLIAVESSEGQQLLAGSKFMMDYPLLVKNFESQSRLAYCGVASSVIVLNALNDAHLTQATFFNDAANKVRKSLWVTFAGMSLDQLGALLHAHGVDVVAYHTAETRLAVFRFIAQQNLQTPGDFLLVNYQRAVLGQGEGGHISPVAAYHAATDQFLILDVAAHKYPPVWVSAELLWKAMDTLDNSSGRSRGFIVVRNAGS